MIDKRKIRDFWEERGRKYADPVREMVNLEPDPQLQALKSRLENEVIFSRVSLAPEMRILDLGAGYGQWAMRFAPHVKSVQAVEYSDSMINAGEREIQAKGISNVSFVKSAAEDFIQDAKWDLIFVSGLFMYLNDDQGEKVAANIKQMLAPGGRVFLRESVSLLPERHIIEEKWSEAAGANYSALYRKPEEFARMLMPLALVEEGYFFPDGSPLNKWKETRLKYFLFEKGKDEQ